MPKAEPDPLAAALLAAPPRKVGAPLVIDQVWGDRPEVLDAIRTLGANGTPVRQIADVLSRERPVHPDTIRTWLRRQGVIR